MVFFRMKTTHLLDLNSRYSCASLDFCVFALIRLSPSVVNTYKKNHNMNCLLLNGCVIVLVLVAYETAVLLFGNYSVIISKNAGVLKAKDVSDSLFCL